MVAGTFTPVACLSHDTMQLQDGPWGLSIEFVTQAGDRFFYLPQAERRRAVLSKPNHRLEAAIVFAGLRQRDLAERLGKSEEE